jgi:hypothetical protein
MICSAITPFCNLAASFASRIAAAEGVEEEAEEEEVVGVRVEEGFEGGGLRIGCFLRGGGIVFS